MAIKIVVPKGVTFKPSTVVPKVTVSKNPPPNMKTLQVNATSTTTPATVSTANAKAPQTVITLQHQNLMSLLSSECTRSMLLKKE